MSSDVPFRRRWLRLGVPLVLALAVLLPPVMLGVTADNSPTVSTSAVSSAVVDDFNGPAGASPNGQVWQHITGGGGYGNGELENNTSSTLNSALDGHGHLVITARRSGTAGAYTYTSARLASLATVGPLVHAEARIKMAPGYGLWPTFWLLGGDSSGIGWPVTGEVDVAEAVGKLPKTVFMTAHGFSANALAKPVPFHWFVPSSVTLGSAVVNTFHVYALDITSDSMTWSIDHRVYKVLRRSDVVAPDVWSFDVPFHVMLSLAVGGAFPSDPRTSTKFPTSMVVDYVRVTSTG